MKLSNIVYAAVGYTLGARAGRERYESIVRLGRRVAGSQTVQSTAGVVQAQVDQRVARARQAFTAKITGASGLNASVTRATARTAPGATSGVNGRYNGSGLNGHQH